MISEVVILLSSSNSRVTLHWHFFFCLWKLMISETPLLWFFFFIFQSYFTVCSGVCVRKCYCLLNIGTFTDGKLSVSVSSVGWEKWVDEIQLKMMNCAWCKDPSSSSSFRSLRFSVQFCWYHCQRCYCGRGFSHLFFSSLECELAPPPGLLWYLQLHHRTLMFPQKTDLHFSQAKGGAAPAVWMIFFPPPLFWMMIRYWRRSWWILCLESGMNGCDN